MCQLQFYWAWLNKTCVIPLYHWVEFWFSGLPFTSPSSRWEAQGRVPPIVIRLALFNLWLDINDCVRSIASSPPYYSSAWLYKFLFCSFSRLVPSADPISWRGNRTIRQTGKSSSTVDRPFTVTYSTRAMLTRVYNDDVCEWIRVCIIYVTREYVCVRILVVVYYNDV